MSTVDWSTKFTSFSYDEKRIIRGIMELYNGGNRFDLDPTYSKGNFWKKLPAPRLKFDIEPQVDGVEQCDCRHLPLENESIGSIIFDPPFVAKNTKDRVPNGIIEMRFSGYPTVEKLWSFYHDSLIEFWRVLRYGGILAFKCQDVVSGGKQHWSHVEVNRMARELGFYPWDFFSLGRKNVLWSPNMANQKHSRKNICYYWVFRKDA